MRFILITLLLIIFFIGCKQNSTVSTSPAEKLADTVYTIRGFVKGSTDGLKVVLATFGSDKIPDTAIFKGDEFEFTGKVAEPLMGEITLVDSNNNYSNPLRLIVENAYINIEGSADSIQSALVVGGLQNTDFASLKKVIKLYTDSMFVLLIREQGAIRLKDTARLKQVKMQYSNMENEARNAVKQYAVEHPKSIAAAFYVYNELTENININELDSIYHSFDSSIHNTIYVRKIRERLEAAKRTAIGSIAPEIKLRDIENKTVTLASIKSKYLLVDFWASWCEPCRKENGQLLKTYRKYKPKGFEILSVSLDQDKQDWQKAIAKDKLVWKQVSDLKGWESSVVGLYGLGAIPASVLIDPQRKIIAKNIFGAALQSKLQELLQ